MSFLFKIKIIWNNNRQLISRISCKKPTLTSDQTRLISLVPALFFSKPLDQVEQMLLTCISLLQYLKLYCFALSLRYGK